MHTVLYDSVRPRILPSSMAQLKVLIIVGPTSSGKSAFAVKLAQKFDGEVISADSRQVYKGLDVGTGKIARREMRGVPHHLLDEVKPHRVFTAHDFVVRGRRAIADISARGKLPIICGGTGFYIDALVGRITLPDVPANFPLRAQLEKKTAAQLFTLLQKHDPRRAKTVDPYNKHRLIRALEIATASPKNARRRLADFSYDPLWVGITLPNDELRRRVNKRLKERLKCGMVTEAKRRHARGLSYKRMHALGLEYRSLSRFLQGKISRTELEHELQRAIWHYARRQVTYWRRNKKIKWFSISEKILISKTVKSWLSSQAGVNV